MVPIPLHYREDVEYVMIPHGFIMDRTEALANEIFEDHGDEPLVCLCVLNGGYRFFNDLTFRIQSKNRNSSSQSIPITVDFIRFKSYKNTESVGEPQLIGHCDLGYIKGKVFIKNVFMQMLKI
jgi:hypoxanthine-guanine phosphoribosyltransferase